MIAFIKGLVAHGMKTILVIIGRKTVIAGFRIWKESRMANNFGEYFDRGVMTDIQKALLGDKDAAERLTEEGDLLPCCCGGNPVLVCFEKRGIPSGNMGYLARIKCTDCWAELSRWALKKKWAKESAKKAWNTRAPILTPEQMKRLEETGSDV